MTMTLQYNSGMKGNALVLSQMQPFGNVFTSKPPVIIQSPARHTCKKNQYSDKPQEAPPSSFHLATGTPTRCSVHTVKPLPQDALQKSMLSAGDLIKERWRIVDKLGSGGFGEIYKAIDTKTAQDWSPSSPEINEMTTTDIQNGVCGNCIPFIEGSFKRLPLAAGITESQNPPIQDSSLFHLSNSMYSINSSLNDPTQPPGKELPSSAWKLSRPPLFCIENPVTVDPRVRCQHCGRVGISMSSRPLSSDHCVSTDSGISTTLADLTDKYVAVKVESNRQQRQVLRMEVAVLRRLQGKSNVCQLLGCGKNSRFNYIVMTLQGKNLAELRRSLPNGIYSLSTAFRLTVQCIDAIKMVHEAGFLHRDIKPSNFTIQRNSAQEVKVIILDFGLARPYTVAGCGSEVRNPRAFAGFRGTVRYASINAHSHQDLARRDDLWSLFYMFLEFTSGQLPWRRIRDKDLVGKIKATTDHKMLALNARIPEAIAESWITHLSGLEYRSEPDYNLLNTSISTWLNENGVTWKSPYDWESITSTPHLLKSVQPDIIVPPQPCPIAPPKYCRPIRAQSKSKKLRSNTKMLRKSQSSHRLSGEEMAQNGSNLRSDIAMAETTKGRSSIGSMGNQAANHQPTAKDLDAFTDTSSLTNNDRKVELDTVRSASYIRKEHETKTSGEHLLLSRLCNHTKDLKSGRSINDDMRFSTLPINYKVDKNIHESNSLSNLNCNEISAQDRYDEESKGRSIAFNPRLQQFQQPDLTAMKSSPNIRLSTTQPESSSGSQHLKTPRSKIQALIRNLITKHTGLELGDSQPIKPDDIVISQPTEPQTRDLHSDESFNLRNHIESATNADDRILNEHQALQNTDQKSLTFSTPAPVSDAAMVISQQKMVHEQCFASQKANTLNSLSPRQPSFDQPTPRSNVVKLTSHRENPIPTLPIPRSRKMFLKNTTSNNDNHTCTSDKRRTTPDVNGDCRTTESKPIFRNLPPNSSENLSISMRLIPAHGESPARQQRLGQPESEIIHSQVMPKRELQSAKPMVKNVHSNRNPSKPKHPSTFDNRALNAAENPTSLQCETVLHSRLPCKSVIDGSKASLSSRDSNSSYSQSWKNQNEIVYSMSKQARNMVFFHQEHSARNDQICHFQNSSISQQNLDRKPEELRSRSQIRTNNENIPKVLTWTITGTSTKPSIKTNRKNQSGNNFPRTRI